MTDKPQDDDVPVLRDLVRHGRKSATTGAATNGRQGLNPTEIEAIAARIVAEHVPLIEQAVARAIRDALAAQSPAIEGAPEESDDGSD